MADDRELNIKVTAKNETAAAFAATREGLAGINKQAAQLPPLFDRAKASLAGLGPAIATTFAVTGIAAAGKQVLDFADHVSNLSQRLGISTDYVQKWELAFAPVGVEVDTVAKAAAKLAENLVGGDKGAVDALKKLGLSADKLKGMNIEEQFTTVADAIGRVENVSERIYASKTLFGKSGVELLAGLNGHLRETTDSFDRMGLIISGETIKAADDFGDQLGLMGKQLLGIVATVVGPLLPALSALGSGLMWIGSHVIGPVLNIAVKGTITLLEGLWISFANLLARLAELSTKIPAVGKHLGFMGDAATWLRNSAAAASTHLASLWSESDQVGKSAGTAAGKIRGFGEDTDKAKAAAKKAAEEYRKWREHWDNLNATAEELDGTLEGEIRRWLALGKAHSDIAGAYGVTEAQVQAVADAMKFERSVIEATTQAFGAHMSMVGLVATRYGDLHGAIRGVNTDGTLFARTLGQDLNFKVDNFGSSLDFTNTRAKELLKSLRDTPSVAQQIGNVFKTSFGSLNNIFQSAFEGGGGWKGAVQSWATQALAGITEMIPGVGPIISQFSGAIVAGFKNLFGKSEESRLVNKPRQAFIDTAGGLEVLNQKVLAATGSLKLVQDLLGAKKEADYKKAVDAINQALEKMDADLKQAGEDQRRLSDRMSHLTDVSPQLEDALKKVYDAKSPAEYEAALKGVNAVLDEQDAKQKKLDDTLARYGLTWQELGPKARAAKLGELAKGLSDDWQLLVDSGVDVNHVMEAMKDKVQDLVKQAKASGTEIPESMRPLLQTAIDAGVLFDENGKKIENLDQLGVKFGDTFDESMKKVAQSMKDVVDVLERIADRLGAIPLQKDIHITSHYDEEGNPPGDRDEERQAPGHAAGGLFRVPHLARIAENAPEIVGDQGFITRALESALIRIDDGARIGVRPPGTKVSIGDESKTGNVNVTVNVDARGALLNDYGVRELARILQRELWTAVAENKNSGRTLALGALGLKS